MRRRSKMKRSKSKRLFSRTADKTHRYNVNPTVKRGGIRL